MRLSANYDNARAKAIAFLKSKSNDFFKAVSILEEAEFKPIYVAKIKKAGENAETREGLMTTLRQMIRAWASPSDIEMMDEMAPEKNVASNVSEETVEKMDVIFTDNETPIGKLIRHFSDLYKTRAKMHRTLSDIGEKNDDDSISRRKTAMISIEAISKEMDDIWPYIDRYETSHIQPSAGEVDKILSGAKDSSSSSSGNLPSGEGTSLELPASFSTMTRAELVAERKNISARIRRTKNKLEYQAEAVAGRKPNPLPEGSPKRIKFERRLEKLTQLLNMIDLRIAEFG